MTGRLKGQGRADIGGCERHRSCMRHGIRIRKSEGRAGRHRCYARRKNCPGDRRWPSGRRALSASRRAMPDIAEVIGAGLKLPVKSIAPDEAADYFGWIAGLATIDVAASSALTRHQLGWNPTGPDLLTDLHNMDYSRIERGRTMNLVDEASFLSFRGSCPIRKLGFDADLLGVLVDGLVPRGAGAAAIGSSFG